MVPSVIKKAGHAYLIGVNRYGGDYKELKTPIQDITAIKECLKDFSAVTPFENPTLEEFKGIITKIKDDVKTKKLKRVLIYFAGHGRSDADYKGEPKGKIVLSNIQPQSANGIQPANKILPDCLYDLEELIKQINTLTCKHLLLVLDCCYAGTVQWELGKRSAGYTGYNTITDRLYLSFIQNDAWQVITSSASNQAAIDSLGYSNRDEKDGSRPTNSPFATQFINALKGKEADTNYFFKSNLVTAVDLYRYIRYKIVKDFEEEGVLESQSPGFMPLNNHKNGEFVFSLPDKPISLTKQLEITKPPFKGFDSYEEEDADVYFGRNNIINGFRKDIDNGKRIFFVSGPSGIGKSSLVKAGLLPALKEKKPTLKEQATVIVRPSMEFYNKILPEQGELINMKEPGILIIDQFEEINYLHNQKTDQAKTLESKIRGLIKDSFKANNEFFLFITVRSDSAEKFEKVFAESAPDKVQQLAEKINVTFPSRLDLKSIILEPLRVNAIQVLCQQSETHIITQNRISLNSKNHEIDDDIKFIDGIVDNYRDPASLPFLSCALHTWYEDSKVSFIPNQPRLMLQSKWHGNDSIDGVFKRKLENYFGQTANTDNEMLFFRLVHYVDGLPRRKKLKREEKNYDFKQNTSLPNLIADRIIRYVDETQDVIELSHDSIIERWLVHQEWFNKRINKEVTLNKVPELSEAVIVWRTLKTKFYVSKLWYREKELETLKTDIEKTAFAVYRKNAEEKSLYTQLANKILLPRVATKVRKFLTPLYQIKSAAHVYYTDNELKFIKKSAFRRNWLFISSYAAIVLALLAIWILYVDSARNEDKAIEENKKNIAAKYVARSTEYGETEALFLLKYADSLTGYKDPVIRKKISELINNRSTPGNPFAIAAYKLDNSFDDFYYEKEENKILLSNSLGDTTKIFIGRDSILNNRSEKYKAKIKSITFNDTSVSIFSDKKVDVKIKGSIKDAKPSASKDSLFILYKSHTVYKIDIYNYRGDLLYAGYTFDYKEGFDYPLLSADAKFLFYQNNGALDFYIFRRKSLVHAFSLCIEEDIQQIGFIPNFTKYYYREKDKLWFVDCETFKPVNTSLFLALGNSINYQGQFGEKGYEDANQFKILDDTSLLYTGFEVSTEAMYQFSTLVNLKNLTSTITHKVPVSAANLKSEENTVSGRHYISFLPQESIAIYNNTLFWYSQFSNTLYWANNKQERGIQEFDKLTIDTKFQVIGKSFYFIISSKILNKAGYNVSVYKLDSIKFNDSVNFKLIFDYTTLFNPKSFQLFENANYLCLSFDNNLHLFFVVRDFPSKEHIDYGTPDILRSTDGKKTYIISGNDVSIFTNGIFDSTINIPVTAIVNNQLIYVYNSMPIPSGFGIKQATKFNFDPFIIYDSNYNSSQLIDSQSKLLDFLHNTIPLKFFIEKDSIGIVSKDSIKIPLTNNINQILFNGSYIITTSIIHKSIMINNNYFYCNYEKLILYNDTVITQPFLLTEEKVLAPFEALHYKSTTIFDSIVFRKFCGIGMEKIPNSVRNSITFIIDSLDSETYFTKYTENYIKPLYDSNLYIIKSLPKDGEEAYTMQKFEFRYYPHKIREISNRYVLKNSQALRELLIDEKLN